MKFRFSSRKPLEHYAEAKELGIQTKPVLVGPLTFLLQGKCGGRGVRPPRAARRPRRGLRRGARGARQARRGVGAVRRAGARRGPHSRGARGARARVQEAGRGRGRAEDRDRDLLRPRRRRLPGADAPAGRRRVARLRLRAAQPRAGREARLARGQDPVRRRRQRPQRVDQRPRREPRPDRRAARARGRQRRGLDLELAAALAGRQDQRAAPRRRGAELDVVRRAEARRGGGADARDSTRAATRSPPSSTRTRRRSRTGATRRARATRRCASGWRR